MLLCIQDDLLGLVQGDVPVNEHLPLPLCQEAGDKSLALCNRELVEGLQLELQGPRLHHEGYEPKIRRMPCRLGDRVLQCPLQRLLAGLEPLRGGGEVRHAVKNFLQQNRELVGKPLYPDLQPILATVHEGSQASNISQVGRLHEHILEDLGAQLEQNGLLSRGADVVQTKGQQGSHAGSFEEPVKFVPCLSIRAGRNKQWWGHQSFWCRADKLPRLLVPPSLLLEEVLSSDAEV
mmetsp:Transcript_2292/g.6315  ORF Transcript_2292/g.6315 Transcript_2292/m.6315 type:complete len:235 (+) Transcript_2292:2719-3423(+)